ncbi:hypothetical protein CspeluHIS016_0701860 [Cutaneotrichosporon spelunceum]|uniref:Phospholipase C/P1 nuclease n=1 Tax=Cutaneotrichosporon spelunceum TaxID=1672016 RepID=A0AAD3TYE6_9TREE|nr:hypothetical protein CspeluHIS016_0701860 [Cutaneotrichosporon spelunceum]
MLASAAVALLAAATPALAWGAAGHEIVATIAQIHLHPHVRHKLCHILPEAAHCHLAPIAAWADTIRRGYPGTAQMHYVNPKGDHPGDTCTYGEQGWINEDVNVLTAIMNKTEEVANSAADIPLRFLVHFLGDMHQPLHLTGRDRGGNQAIFRFEGRVRNLHSVWDSGILLKNIRELGNYTTPLPSKQIESALPGAIFDPYVRWIVWEGIREWWRDDLESWLECPVDGDPYPHSLYGAPPSPHRGVASSLFHGVGNLAAHAAEYLGPLSWVGDYIPTDGDHTGNRDALLAKTPQALKTKGGKLTGPACPYTWSKPIHAVNCAHAWPKEYNGTGPLIELDTPEYLGRIGEDKVIEALLAKGGLRLAKILNEILSGGEHTGLYVNYVEDV